MLFKFGFNEKIKKFFKHNNLKKYYIDKYSQSYSEENFIMFIF